MILAIDFDGTLVTHSFPQVGEPLQYAVEVVKALKAAGHKLILWTAREDEVPARPNKNYLTDAVEWCTSQGLEFDSINEPLLQHDWREEKTLKRKPHVDWFIDDRNVGGFLGWEEIGRLLLGEEKMASIIDASKPKDQVLGLGGIEGKSEVLLFKNC